MSASNPIAYDPSMYSIFTYNSLVDREEVLIKPFSIHTQPVELHTPILASLQFQHPSLQTRIEILFISKFIIKL